jgi:hypothetical protein
MTDTVQTMVEGLIDEKVEQLVSTTIRRKLDQLDLHEVIRPVIEAAFKDKMTKISFPDHSIPFNAIDFDNHFMSKIVQKDHITDFRSVGINDQASGTIVTIMDKATVFENNLVAQQGRYEQDLIVKGDLALHGDINTDSKFYQSVKGNVRTQVQELLGDQKSDIDAYLSDTGVQSSDVKVGDVPLVVDNNTLSPRITQSNIRSVGNLHELQTSGETLLSDVLYITPSGRVGVNTDEPSAALSVWDEETEVVMKKFKQQVGYIGTIRKSGLVIGVNNKRAIEIKDDGTVNMDAIILGGIRLSVDTKVPSTSGTKGDIVFNKKAEHCVGWICLGGNRWADFGKF